MVNNW
jgi:hypothetical protein